MYKCNYSSFLLLYDTRLMTVCSIITCYLSSLRLSTQLFSSEEKRTSHHHMVTVHGAPGPEPFTVFCVTEQTTAKQLLDMVSNLQDSCY